jgi:hypothetical protein
MASPADSTKYPINTDWQLHVLHSHHGCSRRYLQPMRSAFDSVTISRSNSSLESDVQLPYSFASIFLLTNATSAETEATIIFMALSTFTNALLLIIDMVNEFPTVPTVFVVVFGTQEVSNTQDSLQLSAEVPLLGHFESLDVLEIELNWVSNVTKFCWVQGIPALRSNANAALQRHDLCCICNS